MDIPNSSNRIVRDISFHLASSNRELLDTVNSIMKRNGHMTFSDSMGREHYLIDGRNGVSRLSKNIDGITRKLSSANLQELARINKFNSEAIDKVMAGSGMPSHLKGYRYVRMILVRLMENESLISPLSKTIYPEISDKYMCSGLQIDRDIRYAVQKSTLQCDRKSPKAVVCLLFDMAKKIISENISVSESLGEDNTEPL